MSGLLDGKVAIVTGGSKGIGFGIAERFCKEGAHVIICSRNDSKLSKAASQPVSYTHLTLPTKA